MGKGSFGRSVTLGGGEGFCSSTFSPLAFRFCSFCLSSFCCSRRERNVEFVVVTEEVTVDGEDEAIDEVVLLVVEGEDETTS